MPTDHTLLPTGTAESTHRQGLFRKARLVGLALAATPLLLGFGVSAGPNSEYTFQVIRPQLLATRIIPAYAQYTRSISPVGFERDHGDFHSEFTSPRGRLVTITVKAPVTTRQFDVPPISAKETVYDYLNAALYDASGQPRNGALIRFPMSTYSVDFPFRSNCTSATDHQPKYVHWQLPEGASDIVIDGQGSTINFSDLCLGLNLPAVQRVTIKNFTFAWPNIQIAAVGAIIATGGNGNTGYMYDVALPPFLAANPPRMIAGTTSWDQATNHWDLMHPDDDVSYGDGVTSGIALNCTELPAKRTSTGCTVHDIPSYGVSFTVGEAVLVRYYSFATGISISGNDITLDHITLKNLIGSDFAYSQGRGLHISHLLLTRMADQPLSAVGGGSPLTNIGGDVVIDHSSIGYRSDDAFDMNTTIMRYTPRPVVNNTPMNSFVFDPSHANQLSWPSYNFVQSGDTIAIFDNTLNFKEVAKVVAISAPTNGSTSTLTLDQEIKPPLATQGFIAGDITNSAGARYLISDNEFLFNRARALLLQTPYGWVEHNRLVGQTLKQVYVLASQYWGEGAGAQELILSHNLFEAAGHASVFYALDVLQEAANFPNPQDEVVGAGSAAPVNQNIVVADNRFASDRPANLVNLSSTNNIAFEGNWFLQNGGDDVPSEQRPISVHDASNIYFADSDQFGWLDESCDGSQLLALSNPPPIVSGISPIACGIRATVSNFIYRPW